MKNSKDPTFLQIVHSMLASFFGVQTRKNYERDDAYIEKAGIKKYIITGFALAICFHFFLYAIVKIVLYNTA